MVSPFSVVTRFFKLLMETDFLLSGLGSLWRIMLGFLLAALAALVSALLSGRIAALRELLSMLLLSVRAVPVASFIILVLIWIPSAYLSTAISFLMALPILYEGLTTGIGQLDRELLEMAEVFKIAEIEKLRSIWLPQLLPYIRSSSVTALGLCWKAGVAAELIGLPKNTIGEGLYGAKIYLDTAELFSWTLLIILLSLLCQRLMEFVLDAVRLRIEREL